MQNVLTGFLHLQSKQSGSRNNFIVERKSHFEVIHFPSSSLLLDLNALISKYWQILIIFISNANVSIYLNNKVTKVSNRATVSTLVSANVIDWIGIQLGEKQPKCIKSSVEKFQTITFKLNCQVLFQQQFRYCLINNPLSVLRKLQSNKHLYSFKQNFKSCINLSEILIERYLRGVKHTYR